MTQVNTHTERDTHTHTQRHRQTHTHAQRHGQTHTQAQRHGQTHTQTYRETQTDRVTDLHKCPRCAFPVPLFLMMSQTCNSVNRKPAAALALPNTG